MITVFEKDRVPCKSRRNREVERYGLRVTDLAREMRKSPDSVTTMIGRTVHRRGTDPRLRSEFDRLDQTIATSNGGKPNNGGTA